MKKHSRKLWCRCGKKVIYLVICLNKLTMFTYFVICKCMKMLLFFEELSHRKSMRQIEIVSLRSIRKIKGDGIICLSSISIMMKIYNFRNRNLKLCLGSLILITLVVLKKKNFTIDLQV